MCSHASHIAGQSVAVAAIGGDDFLQGYGGTQRPPSRQLSRLFPVSLRGKSGVSLREGGRCVLPTRPKNLYALG